MVERMADDHRRARAMAESLAALPGLTIDVARVQTNIVIFEPPPEWDPQAFIKTAEENGVLLTPFGGRRVRAMTHADVTEAGCERAVEVIRKIVRTGKRGSTN
jgi:threonine aldolase